MTRLLDIIVPHAGEGWPICRKFFDMLRVQLGADLKRVRVIVVHDGSEPWPEDLVRIPGLDVEQLRIPKGGVSCARNMGLHVSDAEWVMFCDCDDMFASVWALHCILDALGQPEAARNDLLWMPFYAETAAGRDLVGLNWVFVHGKLYRREWLLREGIFFWSALYYAEDSAFNACAEMALAPGRLGEIRADAPLYVWVYNRLSVTSRPENQLRNALGLMDRHRLVIGEMDARGRRGDACDLAARLAWDGYHQWHRTDILPEEAQAIRDKVAELLPDLKDRIREVPPERMETIRQASLKEMRKKRIDGAPETDFGTWLEGIA